jgi:hypothetical protein
MGDEQMIKTGARYVGPIFLYTGTEYRKENYINHSFNPNILYHCGICFALTDIKVGEELTVNYSHVLSENDSMAFKDQKTGQMVKGISWKQSIVETSKLLAGLYENK